MIAAYNEVWDGFDAIIPISAHTGSGLDDLMQELQKYAQEGPQLFPDGETTDQPERQVMGELLREKLLLCLDKEIPHGTAVEITKFSERDSGVVDVDATIYCEKASHKGIIIGKQGAMLKKISSLARAGYGKVHGHQGLSSDLGEGQGKLAGQCELRAELRVPGRITTKGREGYHPSRPFLFAAGQLPQKRLKVYAILLCESLGQGARNAITDKIRGGLGGLKQGNTLCHSTGEDAGEQVAGAGKVLRLPGSSYSFALAAVTVKAQGSGLPRLRRIAGEHHGPPSTQT